MTLLCLLRRPPAQYTRNESTSNSLHLYFDDKNCFVVCFHEWNEGKNSQYIISSQNLRMERNSFIWLIYWVTKIYNAYFSKEYGKILWEIFLLMRINLDIDSTNFLKHLMIFLASNKFYEHFFTFLAYLVRPPPKKKQVWFLVFGKILYSDQLLRNGRHRQFLLVQETEIHFWNSQWRRRDREYHF